MDSGAAATPSEAAALGNYNVLIADEGNDRLLIVSPRKQILWTYRFHGTRDGADDAFFTDHGKQIIVNLEHTQFIEKIDVVKQKPIWQYGKFGYPGSTGQMLYFPDDAYQMPNGNIVVADIRNCRIIEISPDKRIVRQAGRTGDCSGAPGTLRSPNGDTPLTNGNMLVSQIENHTLSELGKNWNTLWSLKLPILYPSDPQPTQKGNIIVAGYTKPGNIIIIRRDGKVLWSYRAVNGGPLDHPSLAEELPNGNIIANDDRNHRVIVIDRKTSRIVWQYGVTGVSGTAHGYLREPDGLDIIPVGSALQAPAPAVTASLSPAQIHSVGAVTWHAAQYRGKLVRMRGYLLRRHNGYILFSDEPRGAVSAHDLPVVGPGVETMRPGLHYLLTGRFVKGGLNASNHNPYQLVLTAQPQDIS